MFHFIHEKLSLYAARYHYSCEIHCQIKLKLFNHTRHIQSGRKLIHLLNSYHPYLLADLKAYWDARLDLSFLQGPLGHIFFIFRLTGEPPRLFEYLKKK